MPLMAMSLLASCNNGSGGGGGGGGDDPKTLEECTWEEISKVSKAHKASKWFKVGDTKTVKVNNQNHKVRIIGFDQDVDKDGKKIGITFEFANLISDENGYSLATQWNDTNDGSVVANHNYLDSSVRMALVGEKQEEGHILWAQKGNDHWSNEEGGPYTNKSVLEMLPNDLTKVLKAPSKYVNIWNDEKSPEPGFEEQVINDKLFLLSPKEMGYSADYMETKNEPYKYYEGHIKGTDTIRTKRQVNEIEMFDDTVYITEGPQKYKAYIENHAGFGPYYMEWGGYYWLRSPYTRTNNSAWEVINNGLIADFIGVSANASSVAPAFCI